MTTIVVTIANMALGSNVKKFREAAGLTQTQLAEMAGMDQQALAALEKRDSKSSSFVGAIAKALGKSVDELLGGSPLQLVEDRPGEEAEGMVNADEVIELIALYQQAGGRGRKFILESARSAVKAVPARWIRNITNEA